jgi:hypothetical protein
MRRSAGERTGGSARVFVRPVVMLVVGLAAGLAMLRVLLADAGTTRGAIEAAAGPPNRLAESVGTDPAAH